MQVTIQGAIKVNSIHIRAESAEVVALAIDTESRRAEVFCTGSDDGIPLIQLGENEYTLYTDESLKGQPTEIKFPEYPGWSVWASDSSRYTIYICLVKERE